MTYKEYYLGFDSIDAIIAAAETDMALAFVVNPDGIEVIRKHAEEAIKEKFGADDRLKQCELAR